MPFTPLGQTEYGQPLGQTNTPSSVTSYKYGDTVYYTSSDTFDKRDYPGLKAVRVIVQGGGGGGGGVSTTAAGQSAEAGGGGGGGYSEKFLLYEDLGDTETVTVGAGGSGGSAGANNGSTGGTSSFGSHCSASGGDGGIGGSSGVNNQQSGGGGGSGSGGDLNLWGDYGLYGVVRGGTTMGFQNFGGSAKLGAMTRTAHSFNASGTNNGRGYGGGGSGARNNPSSSPALAGGDGADGIVIVELYY